jgi:hypothetical protein
VNAELIVLFVILWIVWRKAEAQVAVICGSSYRSDVARSGSSSSADDGRLPATSRRAPPEAYGPPSQSIRARLRAAPRVAAELADPRAQPSSCRNARAVLIG